MVQGWFKNQLLEWSCKINFWSDHVKSAFGVMVQGWFKNQLLKWSCKINCWSDHVKSAFGVKVQGWFKNQLLKWSCKINCWSDHVKSAFGVMVQGWFKNQLLKWSCKTNSHSRFGESSFSLPLGLPLACRRPASGLPLRLACLWLTSGYLRFLSLDGFFLDGRADIEWVKIILCFLFLFFKADFTVWPWQCAVC